MEFDRENVAEIEKYAFLLGSALKNEDTEQFFSIYDSILPKDLPDSKLEEIKAKARQVAELPEDRFNDLVFRARQFSLAPAGTTMSCGGSPSKKWSLHSSKLIGDDDSEDEGVAHTGLSRLHSGKSDTSSLYSVNNTKISTRSSESDTRKFDDDSGVCNSSKATNSVGSLSDHEGSDSESRGHFDYFPAQVKIRSGMGLNLDYDEAHEVKSNHSSQDVNSPRSDFSDGIEMVTLQSSRRHIHDDDDDFSFERSTNKDQDDFNTEEESDEDQNSYRNKYYKQGYRPLSKEEPEYLQARFESSKREWGYVQSSSLRNTGVDSGIKFTSLKDGSTSSPYSRYSNYANYGTSASSEKVKIEKNSYKKDPPFGKGVEQLNKVANSVDTLISTTIPDGEVKNMPQGRKLEVLTSEDSRKKKKKKKNPKDDGGTTDENGNPIESISSKQYRQMRETPASHEGTAATNRYNESTYRYGTFEHLHGFPNHQDNVVDDAAIKKKRKKAKKDKIDEVKSEEIENYHGNKSLDDVLAFIGGDHVSNKKTKKLSPPVTVNEDIPNKTQKANKKIKDKKQKLSAVGSVEEVEPKGDNSAQTTATLNEESVWNNMGNSSGKSDVEIVENGEVKDSLKFRKDKIPKALLKDNIKKIDTLETHVIAVNHISVPAHVREFREKEALIMNKKEASNESSIEEKKKIDKSLKTVKTDKSEMPVSKSDDAIKLDASVTNNGTIKQKNAKNKKNKPTSPTIKVVSDSNEVPSLDLNAQTFPEEDSFIFTDIEVPRVPKEDEFQVVGKKKKKIATKDVFPPYNYSSANGIHKSVRRYEDKRPIISHPSSKLPGPSNIIQTSQIIIDTHARDLSPSAFPALGRHQDGRRNSTGDVPIPSETLKLQDDSDIESVKSLPATQGIHALDAMSPRLNMSYAKMAASAKQSGSSSPGEESIVSFEDGVGGEDGKPEETVEYDPKKAVWKGSPTERRHSIGSSPDGVTVASSPNNSAAASLKAGSQENIKGDVVVSSKLDASGQVKSVGVEEASVSDLGASATNIIKGETDKLSSEPSRNNAKVCATKPVQTIPNSLPVLSQSKCPEVTAPATNSVNIRPLSAEKHTKITNAESEGKVNSTYSIPIGKSVNSSKTSSSYSSVHVHKQEIQKPKSIATNNRKQKSVIFLDKRVEETPENLGISFGFEIEQPTDDDNDNKPNLDQFENHVEKPSNIGISVNSAGDSNVSFLSELESSVDMDIPSNKSSNTSVISSTSHQSKTGSQSSSHETVPDKNTNPVSIKKASAVDVVQRLNGVVAKSSVQLHTAQGDTKTNLPNEPDLKLIKVSETQSSHLENIDAKLTDTNVKHSTKTRVNINANKSTTHTDTPSNTNIPTNNVQNVNVQSVQQNSVVNQMVQINVNEVIVYYGESVASLKKEVVAPSPTNGPTRYCGLVRYLQETDIKGGFNLGDAAAFLTKEWDKTVHLQDEKSESVKVHRD